MAVTSCKEISLKTNITNNKSNNSKDDNKEKKKECNPNIKNKLYLYDFLIWIIEWKINNFLIEI